MERLNEIFSEAGISKVKLAKYLGVSRQMVYNYLEMDSINEWPLEKKMKLLTLLNIKSNEEINDIKVDNDFIKHVNNLVNEEYSTLVEKGSLYFDGINNKDQKVLNDIIFLLKDKLSANDEEGSNICKYLYYFLETLETTPEVKYILAYIAKSTGFISATEYAFEADNQFAFESIFYSAMLMYTNRSASREKLIEVHKKFEQAIEIKHEEKLSRTQELYTTQSQALKELGYTELTKENAAEVLEKMAEIESRKI